MCQEVEVNRSKPLLLQQEETQLHRRSPAGVGGATERRKAGQGLGKGCQWGTAPVSPLSLFPLTRQ